MSGRKNDTTKAFTLIELSIALVIIALIVAGIVVGKDLTRAAKIRRFITQTEAIQTSINIFKNKYNGLPGDITTATTFWGTDDSCPGTSYNTVKKTETCDGTGDGRIGDFTSNSLTRVETFRFWQHLSNAGLWADRFTGATGPDATPQSVLGLNVPLNPINGAFGVIWLGTFLGSSNEFDDTYGNVIQAGTIRTNWIGNGGAILPQDAYTIDSKIDDGLPGFGKVMSWKSTSTVTPNCTTSAVASTARYNVTTSNLCTLTMKTGWP